MNEIIKYILLAFGGFWGWFCGEFSPTFPLIYVAIGFILYDSWTAFELDKRVKKMYPDKHKRPAKFVSYKFWDVVPTMIESFIIILLMFAAQKWIFKDVYIPLAYIAAGVIAAAQFVSVCENKCSCRMPGDRNYRLWKAMAKVFIDKTERHFDVDLSDLKSDKEKE